MNFIKKFLFTLIEIALIVVAFILFSGTAVKFTGKGTGFLTGTTKVVTYNGFEAFLGGGDQDVFKTSFGGILLVILIVAAVALAVMKIFLKQQKILNIVILALCVVSAILLFCGTTDFMLKFANGSKVADYNGEISAFGLVGYKWSLSLGTGSVISGILVAISGVLAALEAFVLKGKK